MALKVMLADGDRKWAAGAKEELENEGYGVDFAADGRNTQLSIYNEKYFAVVLNLEIKNHSGMQVLKFIKTNFPSMNVIAILDNKDYLEENELDEKELENRGVNSILYKPFKYSALFELLEGEQGVSEMMNHVKKREGQSEEEEVEDDEYNYTGIKIEQFFNGRHMLFDIFIKLGKSKFIKILHAGDAFSKDRLNKYKTEKEISHLYFHKKDRLKFIRWNNYFGSKLVNMENVPQALKVNYMKNLTDKYLEEVGSKGMKPLVLEQGKEVCNNIFQMCEKDDSLWKILRDLTALDPQSFSHSYLICLYASMVIKQFDWQSQAILETTAMAGMLHDIGKSKMKPELMSKRPEDMTQVELEDYHKHPIYGVEMLNSIRSINPAVKQIVLQHHEAGDGTGFPFGLKDHKILTLSKIIFLCDEFVEFILSRDITPIEGLKLLVSDPTRITRYNGLILENFMKVFVSPKSLVKHESEQEKNKMMG